MVKRRNQQDSDIQCIALWYIKKKLFFLNQTGIHKLQNMDQDADVVFQTQKRV